MLVKKDIAVRLMMYKIDPSKYVYHEDVESEAMVKAVDSLLVAIRDQEHTFFHFIDSLDGVEAVKAELRQLGYPVFSEGGFGNAVLY